MGARRFDPREGWRSTDTIHLVGGDVDLAHRLREYGLSRAGTLAAALKESEGLPAADRERLATAVTALKAFVKAWRIGRPRPVDTGDLEDSEAVSRKMRGAVVALLAAHDRHAGRFLADLREGGVKGFKKKKAEELAAYLEQAGCLDDRTRHAELAPLAPALSRLLATDGISPALGRLFHRLPGTLA